MVSSPFTPTVWAPQVQSNATATGGQSVPKVVGLTNGNFLVAWTEAVGGPIADSGGSDVVGQIFDPLGNRIGAEFRINQSFVEDSESGIELAARPGGGFVAIYEDTDVDGTSIRVQVYDGNGNPIAGGLNTIQADTGADIVSDPVVASRADGSYMVAYERRISDTDEDVVARFVDASGAIGAEFSVFEGADAEQVGGIAALSNGNFVVTFADADDNTEVDFDPQFSIRTSTGTLVLSATVDSGANLQRNVRVAATGTGFVVVWQEVNGDGAGSGIRARLYDNAGTALGGAFTVNTTTAGTQDQPAVVAMADGGFVVSWDDDGAGTGSGIKAQRFDAAGNALGAEFSAGKDSATTGDSDPALGVLSDGRFVSAFWGTSEIFHTIHDPRGPIVNGTAGADVIAGRVDGGLVNGLAGNDRITGLGAADLIDGGPGADSMAGGGGNDTYRVDDAGDLVTELPGGGTDHVEAAISYALTAEVETLTLIASAANGTGNGLANVITGNDLANELSGGAGADQLLGLGGSDRLDGGADNDVLTGGLARDFLTGGTGRDLFDYNAANETGKTGGSRDQILDFKRGQDDIDLRTIDANTTRGGNQAFRFIGEDDFSNTAGELRIRDLGTNVIVQADRNGDGKVDFEILVRGVGTMVKGDFLL